MDFKKILKTIKLHESTVSMILGALVIIVIGVLLINFFGKKEGEVIPPIEISKEEKGEKALPAKHQVVAGEDLWKISEKYYGTGYNWVDIAQVNNLSDPNQIEVGQILEIPDVEPRLAQVLTPTQKPEEKASPTSEEISPTITPMPSPSPQAPTTKVHTVVKGENLWKIAETYYKSGYNWVDIAKENKLSNPNIIKIGQTLTIPEVEPKTPTLVTSEKVAEPITGTTYTVVKGDNLWQIAVRAYGDGYKWVGIAKENKLSNPNLIHSGNILKIPR